MGHSRACDSVTETGQVRILNALRTIPYNLVFLLPTTRRTTGIGTVAWWYKEANSSRTTKVSKCRSVWERENSSKTTLNGDAKWHLQPTRGGHLLIKLIGETHNLYVLCRTASSPDMTDIPSSAGFKGITDRKPRRLNRNWDRRRPVYCSAYGLRFKCEFIIHPAIV